MTDAGQARYRDLECIGAGQPSNSYRNIVRAGFEERHVIENWIRRSG